MCLSVLYFLSLFRYLLFLIVPCFLFIYFFFTCRLSMWLVHFSVISLDSTWFIFVFLYNQQWIISFKNIWSTLLVKCQCVSISNMYLKSAEATVKTSVPETFDRRMSRFQVIVEKCDYASTPAARKRYYVADKDPRWSHYQDCKQGQEEGHPLAAIVKDIDPYDKLRFKINEVHYLLALYLLEHHQEHWTNNNVYWINYKHRWVIWQWNVWTCVSHIRKR